MENESFVIKTLTADKTQTQLLLEGLLVIRNAAIIKKEFLSALSNSQNLKLIIKNVIKADTAFLQLLVALQKSADDVEKKVSFDIESSAYVKSIIENSGFKNYLPIDFNA
ncbi:MAG: STAS domain-containing protein [Bacteroidota bacterium]|nr:STAS domain-containing protein [Bacteroidota bacterium]